MPKRISLVLGALLVILLAAVPGAGMAAAAPGCTHLHMIGLRGSGEASYGSENDLGGTVNDMYFQLVQRANYEGVRMTVDGVGDDDGYPAVPVQVVLEPGGFEKLTDSMRRGVAGLEKAVAAAPAGACIVLAGYSQGAWAVGNFLLGPGGEKLLRNRTVGAVVLFGDPRFDPTALPAVPLGPPGGTGLLRAMGHLVGKLYVPESLAGRTRSYCLEGDPVCAAARDYMEFLRMNLGRHTLYTSASALRSDWVTQDGAIHAAETVFPMIKSGPGASAPVVAGKATRTEDRLVYLVLTFDTGGGAVGFGFRGANGSSWAEESHPFTSPSYGRVSPRQLEYPFNQACGTDQQYESNVEAWLYDDAGRKSDPVTVHLSCS